MCQIYLLKHQYQSFVVKKAKICFWHHLQHLYFFLKWFHGTQLIQLRTRVLHFNNYLYWRSFCDRISHFDSLLMPSFGHINHFVFSFHRNWSGSCSKTRSFIENLYNRRWRIQIKKYLVCKKNPIKLLRSWYLKSLSSKFNCTFVHPLTWTLFNFPENYNQNKHFSSNNVIPSWLFPICSYSPFN